MADIPTTYHYSRIIEDRNVRFRHIDGTYISALDLAKQISGADDAKTNGILENLEKNSLVSFGSKQFTDHDPGYYRTVDRTNAIKLVRTVPGSTAVSFRDKLIDALCEDINQEEEDLDVFMVPRPEDASLGRSMPIPSAPPRQVLSSAGNAPPGRSTAITANQLKFNTPAAAGLIGQSNTQSVNDDAMRWKVHNLEIELIRVNKELTAMKVLEASMETKKRVHEDRQTEIELLSKAVSVLSQAELLTDDEMKQDIKAKIRKLITP